MGRVETIILEGIPNLPVEQACLSYLTLENITHGLMKFDDDRQCLDSTYVDFIMKLHKAVENRLIQRVGQATKCSAWNALPPAKQKEIMQMGFFDPIDSKVRPKNTKPISRTNLRRSLPLNSSVQSGDPNARAPRMLRSEPFRQANVIERSLRSTGPRVSYSISSQVAGTASGTASQAQSLNRRAPVVARSQSARINTSGTIRSNTRTTVNSSRPNSNPTGP